MNLLKVVNLHILVYLFNDQVQGNLLLIIWLNQATNIDSWLGQGNDV